MKILIINEYFTDSTKNGANVVAYTTKRCIEKHSHEVYFFANDEQPLKSEQNINRYFPRSHIGKNRFVYRLNSLFNIQSKKNLEAVLKQIKPDIVHIHALMELSYSVILALKKYKIPYVFTVHDAAFVCPVMGFGENLCTKCSTNIINCIKNKCCKNNYFNSMYVALKFFINKLCFNLYKPNALIFPSNTLQKYVQNTKYNINENNYIVANCLDDKFSNLTPNYSNKDYFLYVGNLADSKGVNILLEAFNSLPKNIELHIVGTGVDKIKYEKFIQEQNLNNIKFLLKMDRDELILEYKNCISLIVPSVAFEVFGMINIEAAINGKPVIASNIGGIPEIVEHNKTGLLFETGNIEQLKESILKYWNNPELVKEHGKNAYQKAVNNYTEEIYYNKLMNIYKEVING